MSLTTRRSTPSSPRTSRPRVAPRPATGGLPERAQVVSEEAADFQADNALFSRTVNPWDRDRSPGGSAMRGSGHFPGGMLLNPAFFLPVVGPLARSAGDLELAFDVAPGPEGGEEVAWRLEVPPARRERLSDFRVAVMPALARMRASADYLTWHEERMEYRASFREFFRDWDVLLAPATLVPASRTPPTRPGPSVRSR